MEGHDQKAMIDLGMKRLEEIRVLGGGLGSERQRSPSNKSSKMRKNK